VQRMPFVRTTPLISYVDVGFFLNDALVNHPFRKSVVSLRLSTPVRRVTQGTMSLVYFLGVVLRPQEVKQSRHDEADSYGRYY
jgi:hypothetical protein